MARQLNLIPPSADASRSNDDWRLDDDTIERGRRGLAKARAALAQAQARIDHDRRDHHRRDHHRTAA